MYAITFDLDTNELQKLYQGSSWQNAYNEIKKELSNFGFKWQQGSVYFGDVEDKSINAVKCVLAAQHLSKTYPWFKGCVKDIRMLRIEELNDLAPALI